MPENTPPSKADIERLRQAVIGDPANPDDRGLVGAVNDLAERFDDAEKAIRNTRILFVFVVVLLGTIAAFGWYFTDQNHQNAITACQSGNRRVEGQRAWMTNYFDVSQASAQAQGLGDGPIGDYYRALESWTLDETLPFRDCSDLSRPIPKPGPAPSFQEALEESLKHQGK